MATCRANLKLVSLEGNNRIDATDGHKLTDFPVPATKSFDSIYEAFATARYLSGPLEVLKGSAGRKHTEFLSRGGDRRALHSVRTALGGIIYGPAF